MIYLDILVPIYLPINLLAYFHLRTIHLLCRIIVPDNLCIILPLVGQKKSPYRAYGPLQEITIGKTSYRKFLQEKLPIGSIIPIGKNVFLWGLFFVPPIYTSNLYTEIWQESSGIHFYLLSYCLICSKQLFDCLPLDKSKVNDVPEIKIIILILVPWIQCLAGAMDCEVYMVLRIHCKSLDKVVIFRLA